MKKITKKLLATTIASTFSISASVATISIEDYKTSENPYVNSFKSTNNAALNYSSTQAYSSTQDIDRIQQHNLTVLKSELSRTIKLNNPNEKASDVAKRIVDVQGLKNETNIDLTSLQNPSMFFITATPNSDGVINLSVTMNTPGATVPRSIPVNASINGIVKVGGFGIEDDNPKQIGMYRNSNVNTLKVVSSDPNSTVRVDFDFASVSSTIVQPSFQQLLAVTNGKDQDLFSELKKRVFLSKKNGKWVDFNGEIQAKEFTSEANAITFEAEGWGSIKRSKAILKVWISSENSRTGEVEISTKFTMTNASGEDAAILKSLSAQGLNHEYSKDLIKAQNYQKLQKIINDAKPFSRPKGTDAEIVKKIHDIASLKNELGIDLSGIVGSTLNIDSKLNSHGSVEINVGMTTAGAKEPKSEIIPIIFDGVKSFNNFAIDDDTINFWKHSTSNYNKTFTQELTINEKGALRVFFDISTVSSGIVKPTINDLLNIVNGSDKTLFSRMKREVILGMDKGKWIKADGVIRSKEITNKNNAVEVVIHGRGSNKPNSVTVKIWISKYDSVSKKAEVSVNVFLNQQSGSEDAALIKNITFQAINDKYQNNLLHVNNLAKVKEIINNTKIKKLSSFEKASEIASKITDKASLKKELGIDLSAIKGSIIAIKAKGKANGEIDLEITTTTTIQTSNGPLTKTDIVNKKINHILDKTVDINILQKDNLAKLNTALNGATTIKVPTDKASAIASRITDAAKLKDELGIDLTSINGSTFKVSATG
ncbi:hypothetical protein, partial [Mycoplasma marinum]